MKTKSFLFLAFFIVLLLSCASCNNNALSEAQIKDDIIASDVVQNCFSSEYTIPAPYTLQSFTITKEKIDENNQEDLLYCDITIVNDYFKIDLSSCCKYTFYDRGGWILEDITITDKFVTPIKAADSNTVLEAILQESNDMHYDNRIAVECAYNGQSKTLQHGSLSVKSSELLPEQAETLVYMTYNSAVLEVNGYSQLDFSQEYGWQLHLFEGYDSTVYFCVDDYTADYSSALGTFSSIQYPGYNIIDYTLTIQNITNSSIFYTLRYEGLQEYQYIDSTILEESFDPLTGTVSLRTGKYLAYGNEFDSDAGSFQYNPIDDRWDSTTNPTYPDSANSSQFFVPRQLGR